MTLALHGYFRSSASYRVRIALNLKGVAYDSVTVHLSRDGGAQHGEAYRALNPQGLVPLLVDGDLRIAQSLAIIDYVDARFPDPRLIPADPVERMHVLGFAQAIACDVHPLNNLRVLKYLRAELDADDATIARWYRHWVAAAFDGLERIAAAEPGERSVCLGDDITLADVCLVPQVFNARRFDCDLSPYPTLTAIADALAAHPAFAAAAPERQPDAD